MRRSASVAIAGPLVPGAGTVMATDLEKPSLRLAVAGKLPVGSLPLTIAERRGGYLAKEGLAFDISNFQGGRQRSQGAGRRRRLASGQLPLIARSRIMCAA